MIQVRNLVKKYGNHLAVDHLSFTVEQGQIYGFLGPNGAGKSTTMNIMTGYLGATEGEVLINGHDILKEPELAKRSIGYLPEIPPLYLDMTVTEYLVFAAELKKIHKDERKESVAEVIALARLEEVEHRLIKNLSKGYRQRVGLAQAMLGFPEIIILDEPTVGLDPKQIIEIRELIRELGKKHTVILSSHILAEVQEVCDHIMIISKGKLVASDTPDNLEKLMGKTETIELKIPAKETAVAPVLGAIDTIAEWSCTENTEGDLEVRIKVNGETDIREELFFAFAKAGIAILNMKKVETSLEDVFLELTEGNAPNVENEDFEAEEYAEGEEYFEKEECLDGEEEQVKEEVPEDESDL